MRSFVASAALSCLMLPEAIPPARAPEAPTSHAEVWRGVQAYWSRWAARDLDGFLALHHDAYSGWSHDGPMHRNKASTRDWVGHTLRTRQLVTYDISAVDIKIHGGVAVVHYYYSTLETQGQGEERRRVGRRTDVLMRQGERWLLIADHGSDASAH